LRSLEGIELFAGLSKAELGEIEKQVAWYQFAEGEQVFDQESDTLDVYFVVSGRVRILSRITPDREVALAEVSAGDYFGELAAIDGKERSARVVAVEDSELASVESAEFMRTLLTHSVVAVRMLERFAHIIRALDSRVTDLSGMSENQRVMAELIRLARPDPRRMKLFYIPDLPNHKEIATWAGTSREIVAQTIGELARMGVVERRSMSLCIHDWPRLRVLAGAQTGRYRSALSQAPLE
jgi:CRP-like cAMP-binding protein